ncbi:SAYSvFN domain-containing protein 1 [Anopheles maculipalpis]|uniref:SAYSvFN domain-containing protein 1 n=1 Tax=Anopheles maculipalpis TaxID=1496333 RepID=UPI0021593C15|nr:SAYSvFN domain-containing protein 1 [Anopheles maculipalpis]
MESKLDNYRKTKRRQALLNDVKDKIYNMVSFHQVQSGEKASHVIIEADNELPSDENPSKRKKEDANLPTKAIVKTVRFCPSPEPTLSDPDLSDSATTNETEQSETKRRSSWLTYITYLVYFLFWATLYAIAIELRFGVVFLMLSALFGIYFNTRTKKAPGEISAYSVFNENCEAIDGTLKAEQFEREIGIRH